MPVHFHMEDFSLYTEDGWINIPAIASLGCWCNAIIGPRQVGKTYSTLKYVLDENIRFIFMRTTKEELKAVSNDPELNPFLKMEREGYHVNMEPRSTYTWAIGDLDEDSERVKVKTLRGTGLALSSVAKIRGFSGDQYTDLVYDEFIPERISVQRSGLGDGFLNAYVTICGNRELEGRPPLRAWLLANSNDLENEILESLGLTREVEKLARSGAEYKILDTGIFLALPRSEKVVGKRKQTALMRHLAGRGEFYEMAMNNQFSYNDLRPVRPRDLRGWHPYCTIAGFYVWESADEEFLHVCRSAHNSRDVYIDTKDDQKRIYVLHPELRAMYLYQRITFSDASALAKFRKFMQIKS